MTHLSNPWKKLLEKRTANIGFISRTNAFKDPSPAEIARAIMIETESWKNTKGQVTWTVSAPYSRPLGKGINLMRTREAEEPILGPIRQSALSAYVTTPMNVGSPEIKIETQRPEYGYKKVGIFQRIYDWWVNL